MLNKRVLAIHLPQFHSIPENDEWWGEGFTEWTNTKKEKPRFKGHNQPHTPYAKEYYDLSDLNSLKRQVELAKQYGLSGFCFYHYWFEGKLLLEKPIENLLKDKTIDFPFCLSWANENWTRRWDGKDKEVLIGQKHSLEDDSKHIEYLLKFFKDKRYIKVDNKPVLLIYRPELIKQVKDTIHLWNEKAKRAGFSGVYFINMESTPKSKGNGLKEDGFDAAMDFQPNWGNLPRSRKQSRLSRGLKRYLGIPYRSTYHIDRVMSYEEYVDNEKFNFQKNPYKTYPTVVPSWDNSARRKTKAFIFHGSTPKLYGKWLDFVLKKFKPYSEEENFVFINAWNEWAEGNHIEPCEKWGYKYLEETKQIIKINELHEFN